jgi:hypothetical protein
VSKAHAQSARSSASAKSCRVIGCACFQPKSSLTLLYELGQHSELVMFTHSAGTAISPQSSQMLGELVMRANIAHEHLDVQSPMQIIDILQAASQVLCAPPPHAKELAVRGFAPRSRSRQPRFISNACVTSGSVALTGGRSGGAPQAAHVCMRVWLRVRRRRRLRCRARESLRAKPGIRRAKSGVRSSYRCATAGALWR